MGHILTPSLVSRELQRSSLLPFAQRCFYHLEPGKTFAFNWHLQSIAYVLEQVMAGTITRLIISVAPRTLKSLLTSVALPTFAMGRDPGIRIITASHTFDLAARFALQHRRIMASDWYQRLFPHTQMVRATQNEIETSKGGNRFAIGVDGALLGRGGDLIIIDDPMASDGEVSQADRRRAWDWFTGVVGSRLDNPKEGAIIVVAQRLHPDDLSGKLLELGGWYHLCLPAIAWADQEIPLSLTKTFKRRTGDLLHPERLGQAELDQMRILQRHRFEAQYQQRPAPAEGYLFDMAKFGRYDHQILRAADCEAIFLSIDSALSQSESADFTAISAWGIRGPNVYLRTARRGRWGFPEQLAQIEELAKLYRADKLLIEMAASGPWLAGELRNKGYRVLTSTMRDDKISRAEYARLRLAEGLVFLPETMPKVDWLVNELAAFPHGRHDDGVDSFTMMMLALRQGHGDVPRLSYYRDDPIHRPPLPKGIPGPWVVR